MQRIYYGLHFVSHPKIHMSSHNPSLAIFGERDSKEGIKVKWGHFTSAWTNTRFIWDIYLMVRKRKQNPWEGMYTRFVLIWHDMMRFFCKHFFCIYIYFLTNIASRVLIASNSYLICKMQDLGLRSLSPFPVYWKDWVT